MHVGRMQTTLWYDTCRTLLVVMCVACYANSAYAQDYDDALDDDALEPKPQTIWWLQWWHVIWTRLTRFGLLWIKK